MRGSRGGQRLEDTVFMEVDCVGAISLQRRGRVEGETAHEKPKQKHGLARSNILDSAGDGKRRERTNLVR